MPQAPIYKKPLDQSLPATRCTDDMLNAVSFAAGTHKVSMSDVIRACIAHSLGLPKEATDIVIRMFRKAARENDDG